MFSPASRKHTFALIGLTGHSGTGKTYGALLLSKGLAAGGKVALIDTENGRGSMYSDEFVYDVDELHPPFTPERYTAKVQEAEKAGYGVLIIDSFSHEWESIGGVLEMAEANGKKGLQKWMAPKIAHKRMVNAILQSKMHVIICMRGKDKMVQTAGGEIVNGGVVPIQEKRVIYEMTVSLILGEKPDPYACKWGKGPAALQPYFDGQRITEAGGKAIRQWLDGGAAVNHDAARVLAQAREEAGSGTKAFREHWARLTSPERQILKDFTKELQAAATAADAALCAEAPPESEESVLTPEQRLDNLQAAISGCQTLGQLDDVDQQALDAGFDRAIVGPWFESRRKDLTKPKAGKGKLPLEPEPTGTAAYQSGE